MDPSLHSQHPSLTDAQRDDPMEMACETLRFLAALNEQDWLVMQALLLIIAEPSLSYTQIRARLAKRWGDVLVPTPKHIASRLKGLADRYPDAAPVLGRLRPAVTSHTGARET